MSDWCDPPPPRSPWFIRGSTSHPSRASARPVLHHHLKEDLTVRLTYRIPFFLLCTLHERNGFLNNSFKALFQLISPDWNRGQIIQIYWHVICLITGTFTELGHWNKWFLDCCHSCMRGDNCASKKQLTVCKMICFDKQVYHNAKKIFVAYHERVNMVILCKIQWT